MQYHSRHTRYRALPFLLALLISACGASVASAPAAESTPQLFALPTVTPVPGAPAAQVPAAPIVGDAQPAPLLPVPPTDTRSAALAEYVQGRANAGAFQGAVLVAQDGRVLLSKGYGVADTDLPATPQTRYRLASLTKQFTAAAILLLQQQGRLKVQDPVCTYITPCPPAWQPITIHQLLSHTSGLPNYTDFFDFEATEGQVTTPQALLARFRDLPLSFAPGTLYSYGNSGYCVLGLIIERVSGQPYAEFMRDAIFAPLGMQDTGVDTGVGAVSAGVAPGYGAVGQRSGFLDASTLFASGNLYSSAEDLARWDAALRDDRLLNVVSRQQMQTPNLFEYGYGVKVQQFDERLMVSHPGLMTGSATFLARFPEQRVVVIVLSNSTSVDTIGMGYGLARIVFGG